MKSQGFNPFSSEYRNLFGNSYIRQFDVYVIPEEKVGQVIDVRVNDAGHFQYFVISLISPADKQVLLPLSQTQIDQQQQRVYIQGMSKKQVIKLPDYSPAQSLSQNGADRPAALTPLEQSAPLEAATPLDDRQIIRPAPAVAPSTQVSGPAQSPARTIDPLNPENSNPFAQPLQPASQSRTTVRLHEERLVVDRGKRRKVGEVVVRKEIETRMVEIPVRREKLIVEQVSPAYEQLAVVDLQAESQIDQLIQDNVEANASEAASIQPSVSGEFTSAEAASRFLDAIAHHPGSHPQAIQISIRLKDADERAMYQQWLERYLGVVIK